MLKCLACLARTGVRVPRSVKKPNSEYTASPQFAESPRWGHLGDKKKLFGDGPKAAN